MSEQLAPIDQTKKELEDLYKERENLYKRLEEIKPEIDFRLKLVETWNLILSSNLLKQNLLRQIEVDNLNPQ